MTDVISAQSTTPSQAAGPMSIWYRLAAPDAKIEDTTWQSAVVHDRMAACTAPALSSPSPTTPIERDGLHALKNIPLEAGWLLDVGCGSGHWSRVLAGAPAPFCAWRYTGVEINRARIDLCERLHDGVEFVMGRAEDLPMADASFGIVLCSGVLQYIRDWKSGLRELSRIARKYVAVLRIPVIKYRSTILCHQAARSSAGVEEHQFWLHNRDEFEQYAKELGLRQVARDYTDECTRVEGLDERVFWLNYVFQKAHGS